MWKTSVTCTTICSQIDRGILFSVCPSSAPHPGRYTVSDLRRLSALTKTAEKLIIEALFVDVFTLMAHKEKSPADHCRPLCRSIKIALGNRGSSPSSSEHNSPQPNITFEGVQLKCVESFMYLSSTISADGSLDSEISSRIHKASQALGKLKMKVLQQKDCRHSSRSARL